MVALPPGSFTVLGISGAGIPTYSARGLHQTIEPISVGVNVRRTVNGLLVNLAPLQFAKYKSRITGSDVDPPAVDGIFPGEPLTVDCIAELSFLTGAAAQRPAVPNSERTDGAWTFYRPQLEMMVVGFSLDTDEWGAQVAWSLDLEEI